MEKFFLYIGVMILCSSSAWAQGFFASLPDVPLMQGLYELEDRALSFDKPEGRIMVGAALIDDSVAVESLQSYYNQALPQFGWVSVGAFSYLRGLEKLQIVVKEDGSQKILEITISP